MAAREDHIVPWKSAYDSARLLGGEVEFVLSASGHIAGAINPASKNRRNYWVGGEWNDDPDRWFGSAQQVPGSWWNHWIAWIKSRSGAGIPAPEARGARNTRRSRRRPDATCGSVSTEAIGPANLAPAHPPRHGRRRHHPRIATERAADRSSIRQD